MMEINFLRSTFCFAAIAIAACNGKTNDAGVEATVPALAPLPQSAKAPFDAGSVAAARATCAAPHGPVDPYSDAEGLGQRVVGAWLHCDPNPSLGPKWPGIEFDPDGTVTVLLDDGAGGLMRGEGIYNQGQWTIDGYDGETPSNASNATYYLNITGAGAAASPVPMFETAPRRLDYEEAMSPWFVPLSAISEGP